MVNVKELIVKSPAFANNGFIPTKYTCDGEDVNPSISIEGIPDGTQSLALIVDDPDAPMGTWDHWIVWNIPPSGKIEENSVPGVEGLNDFRKHSYGGPCPPSGTHRYFFKIYALDTKLNLNANTRKKDLEKAMQGHILAKGELVGRYSRK
jgi:Raf kinase inhibitor-like YbhB/YbcL family protein